MEDNLHRIVGYFKKEQYLAIMKAQYRLVVSPLIYLEHSLDALSVEFTSSFPVGPF